jgi:serine/threonine protein kinase
MVQAGDKIGPYEILNPLGQGGMATVFRAYHERLDRHVAIKVIHQSLLQDETFLARFAREARIVARLEHQHIVPIYDYSESEGTPYLVMKYIEGPTLKKRAMKTGLSLEESARLMTDIAAALDYAHARDVLHRDMKPSNILLDMDSKPFITDFGLARIAQSGTSTMSADMMLGTPYYISPEQAQGEKNLDRRTDIYSFGVILYELVTGTVPFTADAAYAIVYAHIHQPAPAPSERNPNLPPGIDTILLKAMAKKPEDRYPSASALMNDFNAALQSAGISAPPPLAGIAPLPSAQVTPPKSMVMEPPPSAVPTTLSLPASPAVNPSDPTPPSQKMPLPPEEAEEAQPDSEIMTDRRGKRVQLEGSLDLGSLAEQISNMDWNRLGEQAKNRFQNWASVIEERIDSELKSRGADLDAPESEETRIRRKVEKRLKARREIASHIMIYLGVNTMLLLMWATFAGGIRSFPWPLFPIFFWGIGVISQIGDYYTKYGQGAQNREATIEREVRREMERSQARGKSKNERKGKRGERLSLEELDNAAPEVRLNEEGELSDSFVQETEEYERRQRRGRR